jgi:hypothetical protein
MPNMMKVGLGYNVQLSVDVKHKLIAEEEVSNNVLDIGLLAPTVESAMKLLGCRSDRRQLPIVATTRSKT